MSGYGEWKIESITTDSMPDKLRVVFVRHERFVGEISQRIVGLLDIDPDQLDDDTGIAFGTGKVRAKPRRDEQLERIKARHAGSADSWGAADIHWLIEQLELERNRQRKL